MVYQRTLKMIYEIIMQHGLGQGGIDKNLLVNYLISQIITIFWLLDNDFLLFIMIIILDIFKIKKI